MAEESFSVNLRLIENYLFEIDFGEFGNTMADEPEPVGGGEGPSPSHLLGAAVANCLCASLLFAIRKFKEDPGEMKASITGHLKRVDKRLRIDHLDVEMQLGNNAEAIPHLQKAMDQFEDFCIITQSVRDGIPVNVTVKDSSGKVLKSEGQSSQ